MKKMLLVQVEGVYATFDKGQKEFTSFEFEKPIPLIPDAWINSMVQRRYIQMWIKAEMTNKNPKFFKKMDELVSCRIIDYKVIDRDDKIVGADLLKIDNEEMLQDIACKYLLIEVPAPYTTALSIMRQKVAEEYLKVVMGIKIDSDKDREQYSFFKKNQLGDWVLDFSGQSFIMKDITHSQMKDNETVEKKSLAEILNQPIKTMSDDELFAGL